MYTVVTRFRVASGRAEEYMELLESEVRDFISRMPGYRGSQLYRYQGDTYRFMHIVLWDDRENSYAMARDKAFAAKRAGMQGLMSDLTLECYDQVADDAPARPA